MMTNYDLVARLKGSVPEYDLSVEAASAIESLMKENNRLLSALKEIAEYATSDESDESISYSECGADVLIETARNALGE